MENIDMEWFFKYPGLLITCGVVLILIAILVLIIGSSKEKKKSQEEANLGVDSMENETTNENVVAPLINPTVNTEPVTNSVNTIGGSPVNVAVEEKKEAPVTVAPSFEPVIAPVEPASNVVAQVPVEAPKEVNTVAQAAPVVEEKTVVAPIITPIEPVTVAPVVTDTVKIETPVAEVVPTVENQVAEEAKTVEVNVTPAPTVQVEVPKEEAQPIEIGVPNINAEIKVEPVVETVTPVVPEQPKEEPKPVSEAASQEIPVATDAQQSEVIEEI